jgi:hypothetical protein
LHVAFIEKTNHIYLSYSFLGYRNKIWHYVAKNWTNFILSLFVFIFLSNMKWQVSMEVWCLLSHVIICIIVHGSANLETYLHTHTHTQTHTHTRKHRFTSLWMHWIYVPSHLFFISNLCLDPKGKERNFKMVVILVNLDVICKTESSYQ